MAALYTIPDYILTALILALAIAAVLQTACLLFGMFAFRYRANYLIENALDISVLIQILIMETVLAVCCLHSGQGFIVVHGFETPRNAVFVFTALASIICVHSRRDLLPLGNIIAAAITLPAAEDFSGAAFPVLFATASVYWLFRAVRNMRIRRCEQLSELSVFSVKEAVDTMDFGLMFFRTGGAADGRIMLANTVMQDLMFSVAGMRIYNGNDFCRIIDEKSSSQEPGSINIDGRVWEFSLRHPSFKKHSCSLLVATDITEYHNAAQELYMRRNELEKRNGELREMLGNLESVCHAEELMRMKGRIHDMLGQRISLMLRSLREHREPDSELLSSFAGSLMEDLRKMPENCEYNLNMLVNDFKNLGVSVYTEGELPENETLKRTYFEIALEAVSNSVRHGYATEIYIRVLKDNGIWKMTVHDNGIPGNYSDAAVIEGGGFKSMRRRVSELGGTFRYETEPDFRLFIEVPEL